MYPIVFSYKIIQIGGYGIMLGLAFYLAFALFERELKIHGKDPELAYKLLLLVIPSAIIGAKIFHIIENFDSFLNDPFGMIFSGAGLTVYGGFIVALSASVFLIRANGEKVLEIFDLVSAPMSLGYAIGRIGCHVAGDGCYGIRTDSFLGVAYPNGIVPTSSEVLPTPLFESFVAFMIVILLLHLRKRTFITGRIFFLYLILNGIARFSVEFVRLNEKIALGLTQAQFIAILFAITGIIGWVMAEKIEQGGAAAG